MSKLRFTLLFTFILILAITSSRAQQTNFAIRGEINLKTVDFDKNTLISLDGDWSFYWKQFIPPEDFLEKVEPEQTDYFTIPALWNNFIINGKEISGKGFATYHLKVEIDKLDKIYGIKVDRIESAYKLWIDDKLLIEVGNIDTSETYVIPSWEIKRVLFTPEKKDFHITIQIANFDHRKGGIANSIEFGSDKAIESQQNKVFFKSVFILAVLLIIAFHHLGLYFLNKKEVTALYFAFLTLSTALYVISRGEFLVNYIFGVLPFELNVKINWWSSLIGLSSFAWFSYASFNKFYNKKILKIISYSIAIFWFIILILPSCYFTHLIIIFYIVALSTIIFTLVGIIKAVINKETGANLVAIGTIILFISILNDILNDTGTIITIVAVPIGIFIFVLIQSFMLALRSSLSQKQVEMMNAKIETLDRIKGKLILEQNYKLRAPIKILTQELGFTKGYIISPEDDTLEILAGCDSEANYYIDRLPEMILNIEQIVNHKQLPVELLLDLIKKKKVCQLNNYTKLEKSADYFKKATTKQALCYPILENNCVKTVLYFEDKKNKISVNNNRISLLNLLESQILTIIENDKIFGELEELTRTLEEKVEQRTAEVYQQKEEIAAQRDEIEEKNQRLRIALDQKEYVNRTLTDSINYAKRIQQSLLPSQNSFENTFPSSFVFLKPKDVLSGDFYWIKEKTQELDGVINEFKIIAAIDCTGHGVPGALMSIIANDLLEQAINEHHLISPAKILSSMEIGIKSRLQSEKNDKRNKDGMDISLVIINLTKSEFYFAGAHNPIYYIPKGVNDIEVLASTPYSIGGFEVRNKVKSFKETSIKYKSGETIYMFSDGYYDQIGGLKGRKFMKQAFKKLLITNYDKSMNDQYKILNETFISWKSNLRQIDDILVIGFNL